MAYFTKDQLVEILKGADEGTFIDGWENLPYEDLYNLYLATIQE